MKHHDGHGMSFGGTLALIFIVLKLTDNIDWNWIWVSSPIWLTILFTIVTIIVAEYKRQKYSGHGFADKNP